MLRELGIEIASHVIRVGRVELDRTASWEEITAVCAKDEILLSCVDPARSRAWASEIAATLCR